VPSALNRFVRFRTAAVLAAVGLVVVAAGPVDAAPPSPVFGSAIDAWPPGADRSCDPVDKPGVIAFRDLVLKAYPGTGRGGISRACATGSDHESGRAWDWPLDAARPADQARAKDLLDWLLASDEYNNPYARARRLGITYVIWDRQFLSVGEWSEGWRPYTGTSPHTDHVHFSFSAAGADRRTSWWVPLPEPDYAAAPGARSIARACPEGVFQTGRFADVDAALPHRTAIDCVAWWGVAQGRPDGTYGPFQGVTRAQMAQMLTRALVRSGAELPEEPADAFTDDDDLGEPVQLAIDQLAELGIARGNGQGLFSPGREVNRAQMATFLVSTVERRTGRRLPLGEDYFNDDNNERAHGDNIGKATAAGLVGGAGGLSYKPLAATSRAQMASFLARALDLLVAQRKASLPTG
jgi:hypothetical protein